MSNSDIEQTGTVKGHLPNEASLSGRISNGLSLSGHISIGGAGDFIIKMTVESNDGYYTVASCDATVEQIDAAVSAEKRVVLIATDTTSGGFWEMPLVQAFHGETYIFMAYTFSGYVMSTVYKYGENETWEFVESGISSESIDYYDSTQQTVINVKAALDNLVPKSHTHANKAVLDKFAETDGKPTYDGEDLGGASDFIIRMTIEVNGDNYTVTSCDKTMEQIDAAVASGQNIKAIAFDKFIMPMTQIMEYGESYTFGAFLGTFLLAANVYKNPESGTDDWEFYSSPITADIVEYSNVAMPRISTVSEALDELVPDSHTHTNKAVLDKFAETDGKPTYNGEALGSGAGDFIIKMTVESNGSELIVTSCDTTVEQIDEAVAAEKRVVLIASIDSTVLELPMIQGDQGYSYYFGAFLSESVIFSTVYKTENTSSWAFAMMQIWAGAVDYSNDALPNVTDVESALNELVSNSHTHVNKDTLDKLSVSNGKLQYNGSDVGLKGEKGDTPVKGTDYWTAADKTEIVNDTLAALPTWTGGSY